MTLRSAILALLLCAAHAQARTLYVSTTGSHDTNAPAFSTWATAATNIQAAIDAASNGDTVRVGPGTYNGAVTINKTNLTVRGGRGTLFDADKTIISGGGSVRPVYITAPEVTVGGLTFANGTGDYGGGCKIDATKAVIDSCIVRNNIATTRGGGICFYSANGTYGLVVGSIIVGNYEPGASAGLYAHTSASFNSAYNNIVEANTLENIDVYGYLNQFPNGQFRLVNNIVGYSPNHTIANTANIYTTNNSVMQALDIAPASEGVGTNLVWRGVSAYIPRLGSLARKNGLPYAGIATASDGAGGPALVQAGAEFLGRDYSTNRNHGSTVGGVTASTNSPFAGERSAAFDGVSGVIGVGNNINAYLTNSPAITLELWVKNDTLLGTRCAAIIQADTGAGLGLFLLSGAIQIAARSRQADSAQWASLGAQPTNEWIHIAAVSDYANDKIYGYVNGACVVTQSATFGSSVYAGVVPSTQSSCIGANTVAGTQWWDGEISDLRIWSVARTPEQIAAAYTNRLTGTEEGLVGYWPLTGTTSPIDTGPFNLDNPIIHPTYMEAF